MAKKRAGRKGPRKPYQVFVSHATADKWIATAICEKIESSGASTFRDDRDIDGGDDIPEKIRMHIKQSKEFVVLLTPESISRSWVLLEVGAAWSWSKDMRIIVFLCHVSVDPIPDILKSKKAISLNQFDEYVSQLTERVQAYHGNG